MPTVYDWDTYKDIIYQRYITEARSLEETREILFQDFHFKPG